MFIGKKAHFARDVRAVTVDDEQNWGVGYLVFGRGWDERLLEALSAQEVIGPTSLRSGDTLRGRRHH